MNSISKERLATLVAEYKAKKAKEAEEHKVPSVQSTVTELIHKLSPEDNKYHAIDKYGNPITLNDKQKRAVDLANQGESFCLIGPAGTGKTTTQFTVVQNKIHSGDAGILSAGGHKHLVSGTPGIVVCAYTRRAVSNIRRNMPADMQANCITIHKLLEYEPVFYEVQNEFGESKTKMKFEPARGRHNPLPSSIKVIIFEETSMLGVDLYKEVIDACPHDVQFIFLGDIQQLPPIFGPAILGFKLLSLPTVELTEVYRQALESPIISLAHRILSGVPIKEEEFSQWKRPNQLTIHPWKKKIAPEPALNTVAQFFIKAEKEKYYSPEEDMILIPFNKSFGTDELNLKIANHLAKKKDTLVYQVIAGFNKRHFHVGEKVLFDKEEAEILSIEKNNSYFGAAYLPASKTLDYWGIEHESKSSTKSSEEEDLDFLLQQVANSSDEDRVHQCSHVIKLQMRDSDKEISISTAGEVNALLYGYALTVHKSQGSEWRRVFFVLHQSHATMIQRELLYTGVTRAKEELYIICEPETFVKGIQSQRVKGDTLEEKAEYFKGKLDSGFDLGGY